MEWVTTTTLLESLRDDGDGQAWDRLVHRFRPAIVRFALGLGLSAADAEEVAQETLIVLLKNHRGGQYDRTRGRLSSWIFGIAVRQVQRVRRQSARNGPHALSGTGGNDGVAAINDLPDDRTITALWERQWEQAVLNRCLERVRLEVEPTTMRAFELVVAEARSPVEAARILDLPVKAVYNAKHRVLKRIRELRSAIEAIGPDAS